MKVRNYNKKVYTLHQALALFRFRNPTVLLLIYVPASQCKHALILGPFLVPPPWLVALLIPLHVLTQLPVVSQLLSGHHICQEDLLHLSWNDDYILSVLLFSAVHNQIV